MFRAIEHRLIDLEGLEFDLVARDTDALNHVASASDAPDVTAISIAHYPAIAHRYVLLDHGGSVGRGYGPVVIAAPDRVDAVRAALLGDAPGPVPRIAVPGLTTTACLVLRLLTGSVPSASRFEPVVVPIDPPSRTFDALRDPAQDLDAALVIHEGRLTFADEGFARVMDIGEAWAARTGLPLALGGNVIRRDLPAPVLEVANRVLRASIAHALDDREAAITWLLTRPGPLKRREQVDHYLSLYANADTLTYGDDGRQGIRELLADGAAAGWLAPCVVEFAP